MVDPKTELNPTVPAWMVEKLRKHYEMWERGAIARADGIEQGAVSSLLHGEDFFAWQSGWKAIDDSISHRLKMEKH